MSSLSEIRAAVYEQRQIRNELQNELNELASGIYNAENDWNKLTNHINSTLKNGASRSNDAHNIALDAYEIQLQIEKMYALFKNIETANKKIRECQNKSYYDFANYRAVRKIVQALLNNIETTFVHDSTIYKAVEAKHLQVPDYWLTCALLAIMAWKNDDKDMADRALARAYQLDKKNTSMFFFAFHVRIGKNDVALKWFAEYITCERKGEDSRNILLMFAIAGKTIKEDCSDALVANINQFINRIIDETMKENGYDREELIESIRAFLRSYRSNDSINYPILFKYSTENDLLREEMIAARSNEKVLDFILKTVNITNTQKNDYLNQFIDELIQKTNKTEKEVANTIKYNQLIIDNGGNIEPAKAQYDAWKKHNETELNVIREMVEWIYHSELKETNPVVVLSMFTLTKDLTAAAIQRNVETYRRNYRTTIGIKINDYVSNAVVNREHSEDAKIDTFYKAKADQLAAQKKIWPSFIAFGIAVLAIVGCIMLDQSMLAMCIVAAIAAAAAGVIIILNVGRQKKAIYKNAEIEAANAKEIFSQIVADFKKYEAEFYHYDAYYNNIVEELQKL